MQIKSSTDWPIISTRKPVIAVLSTMADSSSHTQSSSFTYVPSSAASTRHVLNSSPLNRTPQATKSTLPDKATEEEDFHPHVFQRRSSNYADADAAARAMHATHLSDVKSTPRTATEPTSAYKKDEATETSPTLNSSSGWKPQIGRTQSWNKQDLRRLMQMAQVPSDVGAGYSSGTES